MSDEIRKAGYGAKAGETIAGNLARGGDGKFTNAGNASAPKPKAKAKGSARAAAAKARAEEAARKKAEREQARQAKLVERKQAAMERELARKKKAEEKAKKGGGGGKKDDAAKEAAKEAKKAAEQAKKAAEKKAAERRKALQQRRNKREQARQQAQAAQQRQQQQQQRERAQSSRQAAARSERQAAASQRRADAQARQQAQAQRQQQAKAERDARQAQAKAEREKRQAATAQRQAAADARREAAAKARAERQRQMDARRAKLDAARQEMQAQLAERRAAAEARARAKFAAWQQAQAKSSATETAAPAPTAATEAPVTTKLAKAALSPSPIRLSAQITKIDAVQRIVEGIASDETPDLQAGMWKNQQVIGDVVDADAIAAALPAYLEWANIREMHQPSAVGVAVAAEMRERRLHLTAKIVDDAAWAKVVEGVYKGFSIGGSCDDAEIVKIGGSPFRKITKLTLTEISLVDRPANPAARFTLWKGHDMDPKETPEETGIAKAAGDPTKAITMLQALRDEAELAGNLDAAQGFSLSIAAALEAAGIAQPADTGEEELSDEDMAEDAAEGEDPLAEGEGMDEEPDPLAMLDDMPDEEAVVAMAARVSSLQKAGRTFSTATMGHLQSMHDTLVKMTGGGLCKADAVALAAQPSDVQKADSGVQDTLAALQARLAALEAQPAEGKAPQTRAVPVEKSLPGQTDAAPARVVKAYSLHDLRRLALTEPNPQLRADYARQLAEAEQA